MRDRYDFSDSISNPYVSKPLKTTIMQPAEDIVDYLRQLSVRNGTVFVPANNQKNIQETSSLLKISGMRESIQEGIKEDVSSCSKDLDW